MGDYPNVGCHLISPTLLQKAKSEKMATGQNKLKKLWRNKVHRR
jgi:hypothetical protein